MIRPRSATRPFIYKEGQVLLRPLGSPEPDPRAARATPRVDYDSPHGKPWGFDMALYLLTKGIATGAMLLSVLLWLLGNDTAARRASSGPAISLVFLDDHGDHPRRRSRSARALLLHPDRAELAIVDGLGRVLPDRARAADDRCGLRPAGSAGSGVLTCSRWPLDHLFAAGDRATRDSSSRRDWRAISGRDRTPRSISSRRRSSKARPCCSSRRSCPASPTDPRRSAGFWPPRSPSTSCSSCSRTCSRRARRAITSWRSRRFAAAPSRGSSGAARSPCAVAQRRRCAVGDDAIRAAWRSRSPPLLALPAASRGNTSGSRPARACRSS